MTKPKRRPKGARTLIIEAKKVERARNRADLTDRHRAELMGVYQTLLWAAGEPNTMAPCRAALIGLPENTTKAK
jgi:hypothetical protein